MEIKLAKTAGFCTGVQRAMNILLDTARREKPPIYTFGPLIHNPQVIALLERRGIVALSDPESAPCGTLIIRAHGIAPKTRQFLKKKGFKLCDATCPHVAQVQSIVKSHSRNGYDIIIIGDKGHAEVAGILGFAEDRGVVVSSLAEVDLLSLGDKICVVAQTTQNIEDFQRITDRILSRFPQAKIFNTICSSTQKRQDEAMQIAHQVEAMVIVGGKNSANTVRLANMVRSIPKPTFHIEVPSELPIKELEKFDRIGVTAGASTPNWIIEGVVEKLNSIKQRKAHFLIRWLLQTLGFLDRSDLFVALGAFSISYAASLLQGIRPDFPLLIIPALYVFAMYLFNHLMDRHDFEGCGPSRLCGLSRYTILRLGMAMVSVVLALSLSLHLGFYPFLFLLLASIAGIIYSIPLIPHRWQVYVQFRRLKDIPASKDIFLAASWASVTVIIPLLYGVDSVSIHTVVCFIFVATLVFIRSVLQDIRNIQADRIVGRETLPIIIGQKRIELLLFAISLPALALLIAAGYFGWTTSVGYALTLCILFAWIFLLLSHYSALPKGVFSKLIIDSNFILSGLVAMFWNIFLYRS
ncbi:MAG: 4-hydroxy-3-methylbut-2-enyl diphosphate reductase [bacterium]|nr:4-hydroxy-3-methylbut-2-enyl diphosphate reductase [bacterium]